MKAHRLRAPADDGAVLAEPPLDQAGASLVANAEQLGHWDHDFQGRRADRLRDLVRRQAVARSREYLGRAGLDVPDVPDSPGRLIVTGHQPELFHPGVWVKNFAAAGIARQHQGVALNLVVDNDILKNATIRVPQRADGELRIQRVEFDEWAGETPFEDRRVRDEERFASFPDRVRAVLGAAIADPVVNDFWPRATRDRGSIDRLGTRFALARRSLEAAWGVRNLEVPLSMLCETEGFLWFASHLLAHLPRFQAVHNEALARYRALYKIRSTHHPVPVLGRQGDWNEAPFWVWRAEEPRRRPLLVRQLARTMLLRAGGEEEPLMEIPLTPHREACCAVEQLMTLPARGVRLRTRALTTTMFARLLLSDLFIHGIGGAKYDELGDEIARAFFGIAPPAYLTLSMTLWLGLGDVPASLDRLHAVDRALRDLAYNPDRHLPATLPPEAREWIEAKRFAIAGPVETHAQRATRFHEIRRANEQLQSWMQAERARLEREKTSVLAGVQRNLVARSREYSLVLHPEGRLRAALERVVPG